jgi:hypothetical protein
LIEKTTNDPMEEKRTVAGDVLRLFRGEFAGKDRLGLFDDLPVLPLHLKSGGH